MRLDALYLEMCKRTHGDALLAKRKQLNDLLNAITTIMRAVPYQFMNGDALD